MKRVGVELQGVWQCPACDAEQADLLQRGTRSAWMLPSVLMCRECGERCRAESVANVVQLEKSSGTGRRGSQAS